VVAASETTKQEICEQRKRRWRRRRECVIGGVGRIERQGYVAAEVLFRALPPFPTIGDAGAASVIVHLLPFMAASSREAAESAAAALRC